MIKVIITMGHEHGRHECIFGPMVIISLLSFFIILFILATNNNNNK